MGDYYLEYCSSAGEGTLTSHGVMVAPDWSNPDPSPTFRLIPTKGADHYDALEIHSGIITPERYFEFIAIHGSEKAI